MEQQTSREETLEISPPILIVMDHTTAGKKDPQDKEFEAQIPLIVFPSEIKTACVTSTEYEMGKMRGTEYVEVWNCHCES